MIPKTIHYCWFGGKPLPPLAEKCIESWKKYLPHHEIVRWDESNYDVRKIPYTLEAYQKQKYAFVSDYARFDILFRHGGVYFDTDVELLRDLSPIIEKGSFMGREPRYPGAAASFLQLGPIAPGLGIAAIKGLDIYREILDDYSQRHFIRNDGSVDFTTIVAIVTDIMIKHGFDNTMDQVQHVAGLAIYPADYFCPKDYRTKKINITKNTYCIHHYDGSWFTPFQKVKAKLKPILHYFGLLEVTAKMCSNNGGAKK